MKKKLGHYLIVDSRICHGQPTFRGTRILVKDVLEQVAQGMAWKSIEKHWRGAVGPAAISEAVRLANEAFFEQWPISNCGDHQAPLHEKRKNKPGIRAPETARTFHAFRDTESDQESHRCEASWSTSFRG